MRFNTILSSFIVPVAILTSGLIIGCGSSDGGKPQSIATDEQVNKIVEMRAIFDKVSGNWETLTAEDKATFTKLAGDDAKAQTLWKSMGSAKGASTR